MREYKTGKIIRRVKAKDDGRYDEMCIRK